MQFEIAFDTVFLFKMTFFFFNLGFLMFLNYFVVFILKINFKKIK
jgi:hypothetical protein